MRPVFGEDYKPYKIIAGETRQILFDCDDINFSDLAIQNTSGEFRQFVAEPNLPTKGYYAPQKTLYIIPEWSQLQTIQTSVLAAINKKRGPIQSWWTMGIMCLPPFFLAGFLYALNSDKKRLKK